MYLIHRRGMEVAAEVAAEEGEEVEAEAEEGEEAEAEAEVGLECGLNLECGLDLGTETEAEVSIYTRNPGQEKASTYEEFRTICAAVEEQEPRIVHEPDTRGDGAN